MSKKMLGKLWTVLGLILFVWLMWLLSIQEIAMFVGFVVCCLMVAKNK